MEQVQSKKILFIIEATLKTGAGKCAIELIQRVHNYSEFTPIAVTQFPNDINDFCSKIGIENYSTNYARTCSLDMKRLGRLFFFLARPLLNRIALKKLKKRLDLSQICLIHSNAISIDFGAYLHKKTHIPHIWHVRDFLIFKKEWHSIIWNLPLYAEKNSSKIITVSNSLKNYLIQQGCSNNSIITIHDGIELPDIAKKEYTAPPLKKVLNVVCVGLICEMKGQETLIDAIIRIPKEKRPFFKFHFFGEKDRETIHHIRNKITENNLDGIILFHDFSSNIFSALVDMDIGVQPSHSEGFSRVTAEYMAAGLCVIAAKEGAIPELIQNGENGLLYEDYNAQELADLLLYCLENIKKMTNYAQKARKDALEKYNFENNYKKILNVYRETLNIQSKE